MAFAMARKKGHPPSAQRADADRAGGCAEARLQLTSLHILQIGEPVDAGTADHGEREVGHGHSFSA